jgi:hypothetical protein
MADARDHRPHPEELLRQVMAQERQAARERLKIFLGYASGVGKTMRMLDEARRRKERGQDVVIGAIQRKRSPDTDAVLASAFTDGVASATGSKELWRPWSAAGTVRLGWPCLPTCLALPPFAGRAPPGA